jgi:hypothetical protein
VRRAAVASPAGATAGKVVKLLRGLETYVAGQSELIIDYAAAHLDAEPISTAPTEGTVQWLLHRRMRANQQMRWSPRGAHMMLKVRTVAANGTLVRDFAVAERWARRPFRRAHAPHLSDGLVGGRTSDGRHINRPATTRQRETQMCDPGPCGRFSRNSNHDRTSS